MESVLKQVRDHATIFVCYFTHTHTHTHTCYCAGVVEEAELTAVIRLIPLDCFEIICTKLSQTRIFPPYSEEKLVGVLMTWQQQSLCNRRQKLAQILLRLGCYRAAIKLDPKCKHTHTHTPQVYNVHCIYPYV